jgi:hypothetical protein
MVPTYRPFLRFALGLFVLLVIFAGYGYRRSHWGIDFTDEGSYVTFPLRLLFGERLFSSELMTLQKPFELVLYPLYRFFPAITLVQLRLAGWALHLLAVGVLAVALFSTAKDVGISLLAACVVTFVAFFGRLTPSYNSLSKDLLLMALSLRMLAGSEPRRSRVFLQCVSGLCMFFASLCYPSLLVVALLLGLGDLRTLIDGFKKRRSSPLFGYCHIANSSVLTLLGGALGVTLWDVGALKDLVHRFPMTSSFALTSVTRHDPAVLVEIATYLFWRSPVSYLYWAILALLILGVGIWGRRRWGAAVKHANSVLLVSTLGGLIIAAHSASSLNPFFCLISGLAGLAVVVNVCCSEAAGMLRPQLILLGAAMVAGVVYALSTFYFTPAASWTVGAQGFPFCLAASLVALSRVSHWRERLSLSVTAVLLGATATCLMARTSFWEIYRDGPPAAMTAEFTVGKLRGIRSTGERVESVEQLYAYLKPQLYRGEPLLVFDDAPLLYFVLDAKPAYGLARAIRYNISRETQVELNDELLAKPLPRYAIRTMINLDGPFAGDRKMNYDGYPLNGTLLKYYRLQRVIFPFEVWKLAPEVAGK